MELDTFSEGLQRAMGALGRRRARQGGRDSRQTNPEDAEKELIATFGPPGTADQLSTSYARLRVEQPRRDRDVCLQTLSDHGSDGDREPARHRNREEVRPGTLSLLEPDPKHHSTPLVSDSHAGLSRVKPP